MAVAAPHGRDPNRRQTGERADPSIGYSDDQACLQIDQVVLLSVITCRIPSPGVGNGSPGSFLRSACAPALSAGPTTTTHDGCDLLDVARDPH